MDVLHVLINNHIPPEWIDHAYPFGLAYLEAHIQGILAHRAFFEEIDNERIARLDEYGTPEAIPAWDGRTHPSAVFVARLNDVMAEEDSRPLAIPQGGTLPVHRTGLEAPAWLYISQGGLHHYLSTRNESEAWQYLAEHPVVLPLTPLPMETPPPPEDAQEPMDTDAGAM